MSTVTFDKERWSMDEKRRIAKELVHHMMEYNTDTVEDMLYDQMHICDMMKDLLVRRYNDQHTQ